MRPIKEGREMAKDTEDMSNRDFDRILLDVLSEQSTVALLRIPGIYEIVSEEFNNEVITRWENEQDNA
jgi:hypothetical protein